MKNIKDITLSIFAMIGFVAIVSGFTNNETESQQMYGTPESHVWELYQADALTYTLNKATGEVRIYQGIASKMKIDGLREYVAKRFEYGERE